MHTVLGATGGIGHWVVEKLLERGESVRVVVRDPMKVKYWENNDRVEIVKGDSLVADDVKKAASNTKSVFHCVNVPYPQWKSKVIPMLRNTLAAARENKVKIVFPGNVYVFGHAQTEFVLEDHPFAAHTKKGKLRVQMELMLREAWRSEGIPYTIVRFPDFYGPFVMNPIYANLFRNAISGRPVTWYGRLDVPIEYSYIEDAASGLVMAGLDPSTAGQTYHLPGPQVTTPQQWVKQVVSIAGTNSKIRTVPGFMVTMAGIFNPLAREFREMLYLKQERLVLDGTKSKAKFRSIPATSYDEGIKKTLEWFRAN